MVHNSDKTGPPPSYDDATIPDIKYANGKVSEIAEVKDEDTKKKEDGNSVGFFELFRFATALDKLLMILGTIFSVIHGSAFPLMIIVFGQMIDTFVTDGRINNIADLNSTSTNVSIDDIIDGFIEQKTGELVPMIIKFSIYYVGIACGVFLCGYIQVGFWLMASFRQAKKIREELFKAICRQEIGWFDTHEPGELSTIISDNVEKIQGGISDKVGNTCQFLSAAVVGVILGFCYVWKMGLVILACSPVLVVTSGLFTKFFTKISEDETKSYEKAGAVAEEVLSGIRTVTAFGGQKKDHARYMNNLEDAERAGIKKGTIGGSFFGFIFFCIFCIYGLAFWYAGILIIDEGEKLGSVLITLFSIIIGAFSLGNIAPNVTAITDAKGAAYSVFKVIDQKSNIDTSSDEGKKLENLKGDIQFTNIEFEYPSRPDVRVLKNVDMTIQSGQSVALVGSSGCGKSTCVQLIQRFYDSVAGNIYIDGVSIKELNVKWWRSQIGIVSQEPVLFDATIAENIGYGRVGATAQEIEDSTRAANAYDFIMKLPDKFNTLVGERGAQLSGGQKQRIAIARAIISNPKILLLDEATSALDTESEAIVQAALEKASEGRTTIIIAHRLSTIVNADKIIVLNEGSVVESGTHNELLALGGYYSVQANNQLQNKDEDVEKDEEKDDVSLKRKLSRKLSREKSNISRTKSVDEGKKDEEEEEVEELPEVSMMRLAKLNMPEVCFIIIGCIAAVLNGIVQPAFALVFSNIMGVFQNLDPKQQKEDIFFYSMMFVTIGVASMIVQFMQAYMFSVSGVKLTTRLRNSAFKAYLKQDMAYFDDPFNSTGAVTTRLATDASAVQGATGIKLGSTFMSLAAIGGGVIIGFIYSWKLTLVVLAFVPILVISGIISMKIIEGYAKDGKEVLENAGKTATETVINIRTVQQLGVEDHFCDVYYDLLRSPHKKCMRKANLNGLSFGFSQGFVFLAYAVCFYYGAKLIESKELDFTSMFKVFSAIVFSAMGAGQATSFAPDYAKAKVSAARMFKLFDTPVSIDHEDTNGEKINSVKGDVTFNNVFFTYPTRPDVTILNSLNLKVESGQTIALVGSSGCGKSTCISLLERFYDNSNGTITIDGISLQKLNISWLRENLGLVQQEPILFDYSIKENIAYGDNTRDVPMSDIIEAAKNANIHQFIETLPLGYETRVGDKGTQLSGGQKQRIAIARALVRNPSILLLDEATSALDNESEKIVQEALDHARAGRTCIVIAHRLSTIQDADMIFVIDNGVVAEQGTHSELISNKDFYYRLNQAQLLYN